MYEQYVMIEKRLLNNKSWLVIVESELNKLTAKTNMKYVSPSFDNVMVQGSNYKMSDIEALNRIAALQNQKTQLLKMIEEDNNIIIELNNILNDYINKVKDYKYTLEYIILRDCYVNKKEDRKKTLREIADETNYSYIWVRQVASTVKSKLEEAKEKNGY
jgi:hypothetical protein